MKYRTMLLMLGVLGCNVEPAFEATEDRAAKEAYIQQVRDGKADSGCPSAWLTDDLCDPQCANDPLCDTIAVLGETPRGTPARYPFVLVHGFNASADSLFGFNRDIDNALTRDGHQVYRADLPPYGTIEQRAAKLARDVDRALAASGAKKVHLVAHSMGGLDSRYLISRLGYHDRIESLTTLGTPHDGSALADALLGNDEGDWTENFLSSLFELFGKTYSDLVSDVDARAVLRDLSVEQGLAREMEGSLRDNPAVFYQSWAGSSSVFGTSYREDEYTACQGLVVRDPHASRDTMSPLLWALAPFVHGDARSPSDGMVTVESARFGNFRGCIPADHLDLVGQVNDSGMDRSTGFDHLRFYRYLAFELASLEDCESQPVCTQGGSWGTRCACYSF